MQPQDAPQQGKEPLAQTKGIPFFVHWEECVPRFLCSLEDIFFVQLGANCGLNVPRCTAGGDPLFDYATQCDGWRGVVLEPVRATFEQLERNYAPHPGVQALHMAATGGTTLDPMTMQVTTGAKSTRNHLLAVQHSQSGYGAAGSENTTVYSMVGLWAKLALAKVDMLVIDVEGGEPSILGFWPLPSPLPRLVLFEHAHLSPKQIATINSTLVDQGYDLVAALKHKDAYAVAINLAPQDLLYGLRTPPRCSRNGTHNHHNRGQRGLATIQKK